MKHNLIFSHLSIIILISISCSNNAVVEENATDEIRNKDFLILNDNCRDQFNLIFQQFTLGDKYYQFDSVYCINPFKDRKFYTEYDLKSFVFFRMLNKEIECNIALQDIVGNIPFHKLYFCSYHRNRMYIDEGSYFNCNASFLNDCGIKVVQTSSVDSALLHLNIRDVRMEETWVVDSCFGEQKLKEIEFLANYLIIDDTTQINYNLYGNELNLSDTKMFDLSKIALSSERLILVDKKNKTEPVYYYLKKSTQ